MTAGNNEKPFDQANGSNGAHGSATGSFDAANGYSKHDGGPAACFPTPSPIAVIGMACRFAGDVTSPGKLWDLCSSGRDARSQVPDATSDVKSVHDPSSQRAGRDRATGGYFLQQDLASFDAKFFDLTSDEASAMDPQLRMLLEVVYEATEDAGLPIEKLAGQQVNTSVFVASSNQDYRDLQMRDPGTMRASLATHNAPTMLSSRISHFYDFQGISMSVDAGGPGALAALHQGCQTLHTGQSSVSIIGASTVIINPDLYSSMSSPVIVGAGDCSNGWNSRGQLHDHGEGVAVLVLKPLDAALRDGDQVHAVIRNSGLNQNGKTTNIENPSSSAQTRLTRQCYDSVGLDFSQTAYIEAQMAGKQLGWDATEANSFAETFGASRDVNDPIWVGAVTTNIGYTGAVSGLASIIKVAMALKHRSIPPSLNHTVGNAEITLKGWHLRVPTSLVPWPSDKPFGTSINSSGRNGTNAHVILEAAPQNITNDGHELEKATNGDHGPRVYLLSAQSPGALEAMATHLGCYLTQRLHSGNAPLPAVLAHTLSSRRSRLSYLATIRAQCLSSLTQQLSSPKRLQTSQPPATKGIPRLGFVFNGQGAQWHAMGRELLVAYPVFKAAVHEADSIFRNHYGTDWSLLEELGRDAETTRVSEMHLGQPVTVALQLCLVVLLRDWGVQPIAITSHSSGEIAAAYAAGALSFRQALGVAYWQGALARELLDRKRSGLAGGMAAGGVDVDEAGSPESVTFAGDVDDLDDVVARLEADGKFGRKLNVPVAYHSHHMHRLADAYIERLRGIVPTKPTWSGTVTYTSPVTGGFITTPDQLNAEHYVNNLTSPVLFSQAFETMCFGANTGSPSQVDAIVEIGPHSALHGPIRQILRGRTMAYVSCLKRDSDAVVTMQELAATLLHLRYPVDLDAVNRCIGLVEQGALLQGLPSYPWDHTNSYWIESRISREIRFRRFPHHELLGTAVPGATTPSWRNFLRLTDLPWVGDHRINGEAVLPATAYVCMAIEAVKKLGLETAEVGGRKRYGLRNVEFLRALTVPETGEGIETHLNLRPKRDQAGWYEFDVRSLEANGVWAENCRGMVGADSEGLEGHNETTRPNVELFLDNTGRHMDEEALRVQIAAKTGIEYGPTFQGLRNGRVSGVTKRVVADLHIQDPKANSGTASYVIHPTRLDCAIQALYRNTAVVLGELYKSNFKGFTSRACVVTNTLPTPGEEAKVILEGLFCEAITRLPPASGDSILVSTTRLEPDVLHSIPDTIRNDMCITLKNRELDLERKLVRASYHLIADAVAALENQNPALNVDTWVPRQHAIFDWMKTVAANGKSGQLAAGSRVWAQATKGVKRMLFDDLKSGAGEYGELLVRVGSALAGIVNGDTVPRELLGQYQNSIPLSAGVLTRSLKHLARLVQLFAVKNPGARVLEIGARTGAATLVVLNAFAPQADGGSLVGDYVATDPDPGAFEAARTRIGPLADMVEFRELNIARDPVSAGFAEHSFDLVVATMALQGTRSHGKVLRNIRKLLAANGKLILLEPTRNRVDTQLLCEVLVDRDTNGADGPAQAIESQQLDSLLRVNGFTGVDFDIRDCEQPEYQASSVVLTSIAALHNTNHATEPAISIVFPSLLASTRPWVTTLAETIRAETGITVDTETLDVVKPSDEKIYILTDLRDDGTAIDKFDQQSLDKICRLLNRNSGILWLTTGGEASDPLTSAAAVVQGLLTTRRQDDHGKSYMLLNLPRDWTSNLSSFARHIVEVLKRTLTSNAYGPGSVDWEYVVEDSVLKVPRVYPVQESSNKDGAGIKSLQSFHTPGRVLVWDSSTEDAFIEASPTKTIPDDMVEIETRAFSADSFGRHGDDDEAPGLYEVAGIVTNVGERALGGGFQVGDNVCALVKGSFASTVRAVWTSVAKIPERVSLHDAACVPLVYSATYYALVHVARLQKDEKVLILHAADSQEAQAAITVARHIGAQLLFAPRTDVEAKLLADTYDIPASQVFQNWGGRTALQASIQKGYVGGVNVVITTRSYRAGTCPLLSGLEGIARFGRWVEIGDSSMDVSPDIEALTARCVTYSCVDPFQLAEHNGQVMREVLGASLAIIGCGDYSTPPNLRRFSVSELDKALELVNEQRQSGGRDRIVIAPQVDEEVKVRQAARSHPFDDKNATYLIAGEVLCADIASWMASEGATTVVVVSSNAEAHPEASSLTEDAAARGCRLEFVNCNLWNEEDLSGLLSRLSASQARIRGVVHVGSDPMLEQSQVGISGLSAYLQWVHAAEERIAGAANLHKLLPEDLSFFVLFSSNIGVAGNAPEAYVATVRAFEGTLARSRASRGLPVASVALPATTDLAMATDYIDAQQPTQAPSRGSISIDNAIELIGAAIQQQQDNDKRVADTQTVVERGDSRFGTLRLATSSPQLSPALPPRGTTQDPTASLVQAIGGIGNIAETEAGKGPVTQALAGHLAAILNVPVESVDADMDVSTQGVDSMVAVEMRNWLVSTINVKLSVSDVLRSPSLKQLAELVVGKSLSPIKPNGVSNGSGTVAVNDAKR
ncbi:putative polyketide synthase [Chaetomium tenue]|uniref:Polyketide synthase n=1 Tax=Chaetomium tenue TaxID=1854479 RepID=A0ACB7P5C0_9PEZI|nr:putative polyketide synthase [Chaetomium globosum]